MPCSFGLPLGLIVVIVGVILYFATSYKRAAMVVIGVGMVITLLTILLIVLAVNSQM